MKTHLHEIAVFAQILQKISQLFSAQVRNQYDQSGNFGPLPPTFMSLSAMEIFQGLSDD